MALDLTRNSEARPAAASPLQVEELGTCQVAPEYDSDSDSGPPRQGWTVSGVGMSA
jgi:hypothetical protein